jgi:hypothetical protein
VKRVVETIVDQQRGDLAAGLGVADALLSHELSGVLAAGRAAGRPIERVARVVVGFVHHRVTRFVAAVGGASHSVSEHRRCSGGTGPGHAAFDAVTESSVVAVRVDDAVTERAVRLTAVALNVVAVVAFLVVLDDAVSALRPGVGIGRVGVGLTGIDVWRDIDPDIARGVRCGVRR